MREFGFREMRVVVVGVAVRKWRRCDSEPLQCCCLSRAAGWFSVLTAVSVLSPSACKRATQLPSGLGKLSLQAHNSGIPWELVRNSESQALPSVFY